MTDTLERRTIRVPRGARIGESQEPIYGWQDMPADCLGGLAVHKALKDERWRWMVTHEASGYCIERLGAMTKARAVANMRAAVALEFDWTLGQREIFDALRRSRGIVDAVTRIGESD